LNGFVKTFLALSWQVLGTCHGLIQQKEENKKSLNIIIYPGFIDYKNLFHQNHSFGFDVIISC